MIHIFLVLLDHLFPPNPNPSRDASFFSLGFLQGGTTLDKGRDDTRGARHARGGTVQLRPQAGMRGFGCSVGEKSCEVMSENSLRMAMIWTARKYGAA